MLGKTHVAFAISISSLSLYAMDSMGAKMTIADSMQFYTAVAFGALLPDIDEPNSTIGKKTLGISNAIKMIFGHRGFTHSIFCIFFIAMLLLGVDILMKIDYFFEYFQNFISYLHIDSIDVKYTIKILGIGIVFGYILHIIGDMMTISGVPFLLPLRTKNYHVLPKYLRFKTGGALDYAIGAVNIAIFGFINHKMYNINFDII